MTLRAQIYLSILFIALAFFFLSCTHASQSSSKELNGKPVAVHQVLQDSIIQLPGGDTLHRVVKTSDEWKEILTDTEYYILREKGTERAFTGPYVENKKEGVYHCGGCGLALFSSDTKYRSGTGWPSFWQPIKEGHVAEEFDGKYGWNRTEVLCGRCGGRLGHVFKDGPQPTGLRYCINGYALSFKESE